MEQASGTATGTVNPDWTGFQPYPHMPPHGYLASSTQAPPPYMWGVQAFKTLLIDGKWRVDDETKRGIEELTRTLVSNPNEDLGITISG
ncbi:hypothetical protein L2E82_52085 [Cichorium intybus]|nr:hypothetical protein L2E82_52085 [Cichorium intybus]